jgi:hypothetical protein
LRSGFSSAFIWAFFSVAVARVAILLALSFQLSAQATRSLKSREPKADS